MTKVMATRSRALRWVLPLVLLLLVTAFLLPPLVGINRFHRRIAESISGSIGRPVSMSSVKMRLLPRPGFEIEDFVVEEDPAFGAEPILRCAQVTAYVRLLSLWRGRLEIARIAFDGPSLNLVRNSQGRWNLDSVLSEAARIPNAPTGQRHAGDVPRFPYIDASDARVNFKFGDEKMPVSFLNADLAVWLANPGEWRIQFAAQPARTDLSLDLANTGILRLEGTLRRPPTQDQAMSRMPAKLHAEWSNAPLGQLSRIFTGSDPGWRGDLELSADISGSADLADLKLSVQGRGIHRVEFEPREPLNLDIACQGRFARSERSLDGVTCLVPTGEGHLLLTGSVHGLGEGLGDGLAGGPSGHLDPALSLEINRLPVAAAFGGLRLVRSGFAPEVQATGVIDGNFSYASPNGSGNRSPQPQLFGQATVENLTIAAPAFEKPLTFPTLHFNTPANGAERIHRHASRSPSQRASVPASRPQGDALLLEPFSLEPSTGAASPLNASAAFSRSGFTVHVAGQSRLGHFAALGREFGLLRNRTIEFGAQGTADLDVTVRGPWLMPVADPDHPLAPVAVDGSMGLRNAELTGDFLAQPLQILSAQALIRDGRVEWNAASVVYGPLRAEGSLSYPMFCSAPTECARQFTLHFASLDAATAQGALLGATRHGEIVQQLLDRIDRSQSSWPALSGTIEIGALTIQQLAIRDLSAALHVEGNTVLLKSLAGRAYSGATPIGPLRLSGTMQMTDATPHYEIEAQLDRAAAPAVASLFGEKWGTGTIHLAVKMKLSGYETRQLASSASGTFDWEWTKGGLPVESGSGENATATEKADPPGQPSVEAGSSLAHFDSWSAAGTIAGGALRLEKSEVVTGAESLPLTGTIDFGRRLSLVGGRRIPPGLKITGTLEKPLAVPVAAGP